MSNSLTDGSAVVVCRFGHRGHRISVHSIFMCGVTRRTWCMDARRTQDTNYFSKFSTQQGALMTSQFFARLHFPQSNVRIYIHAGGHFEHLLH